MGTMSLELVIIVAIAGVMVTVALVEASGSDGISDFNIMITGESNPRIDSDYYYDVQVLGELGDDRTLQVYIYPNTIISEWEFSRYDKELKYPVLLDMTTFDWNVGQEYTLIARIGNVATAFPLYPKSIDIITDNSAYQGTNPYIDIFAKIPTKLPNQYIIGFDVCAGSKSLVTPDIITETDLDLNILNVRSIIGPGGCTDHEISIKAKNPDTIRVYFDPSSLIDNKQPSDNLHETISELEETIRQKDAIIMEQVRVIADLVAKLSK